MLIPGENLGAFFRFEADRNDFIIEASGFDRARGAYLRAQRKLILFLARNVVLLREHLGGLSHYKFGKRAEEAVAIHTVHQFLIAKTISPARAIEIVRQARHGFGAAGEHAIKIAARDL